MYLLEPYSRQENLTRNNFAFRDYYRGALDTGGTYLSNILISASSGRPQANIAVPIYSENNNQTLVGLWVVLFMEPCPLRIEAAALVHPHYHHHHPN
jgi:hypothetical protein